MTENFIEIYYTISEFNGTKTHYAGNSAPVMNGEGWEAQQMQWVDGTLYVLWRRTEES